MSSYHIHTKSGHLICSITEQGGFTNSTEPVLDGLPFDLTLSLVERKGWHAVPVIDEEEATTFSFHGEEYQVFSRGNRITKVLQDGEEISWQQFPDALKELL